MLHELLHRGRRETLPAVSRLGPPGLGRFLFRMSIPAHLYGLPPAVVRMRSRQEREAERDMMRRAMEMMRSNEVLLSEAISTMRGERVEPRLQ